MEWLLAAVAAIGGLAVVVAAAAAGWLGVMGMGRRRTNRLNAPPAVPGLPLIGNLHQLKEKKPHETFTKWSENYGPIYNIRTGASSAVVINSTEVAKEAMVANFSSISTRKLSKSPLILSHNKSMVSLSDYGDFHIMVKRYLMTSSLGSSAQKKLKEPRDSMVNNMLKTLHTLVMEDPQGAVNFREVFKTELVRYSLIQSLGEDVSSVFVEEFGRDVSCDEIYRITVLDIMTCVIDVDWRDFFPYLRWVPNRSFEEKVRTTDFRRTAVIRALIQQQKKRITRGEARESYLDFLVAENTLTDDQVIMLIWEDIIATADTTLVTTEWAMYELSKNQEKQERLYQEIREVCGDETVTEDHLPRLPYLNAVFHETLRRHSAVQLVVPRFVHEDTRLAGYDVPAGTQVFINLYGCNMNRVEWEEAEEWRPERFLGGKFQVGDLYKTMAFGAGKRACAGSQVATTIACASIARFVQDFAWRLREGDEDKVGTVQFTAFKLHPLHVYLTPRGTK